MSQLPATNTADPARQAREAFLRTLRQAADEFAGAQPLSVPADAMKRSMDRVFLAFRQLAIVNPDVMLCTPQSIARALALCGLTGLLPGGANPEVDILPRQSRRKDEHGNWGNGPLELQWQVGWRGYVTLALRAGERVKAVNVFEGERFVWEEGLDAKLIHAPGRNRTITEEAAKQDLAPLAATYAVVTHSDGTKDFLVVPLDEILKRRNSSDGWRAWRDNKIKSTPWGAWPESMVLKTAIRAAAQRGVLALDDVARYAMEVDGHEDAAPATVIDVPTSQPVPQRSITDHRSSTLDGLEESLGAREPERVETPKRERKPREAKAAAAGPPDPPDEAPVPPRMDRELVLRDAKALVDAAGGEYANKVRAEIGLSLTIPIDGLTNADLLRFRNALDERIGGGE
jgi:recombination protein RecT